MAERVVRDEQPAGCEARHDHLVAIEIHFLLCVDKTESDWIAGEEVFARIARH